jgi:TRAP-type mannitol/chloroaromatic compound transport system permease small subunit
MHHAREAPKVGASLLERTSRAMVWVGGAAVLADAFLIVVDVTLRAFSGVSIQGATELGGYVLAIASAWAFAFTLLQKGHVRIDSLYLRLPQRLRPWLDIAALAALTFFMGALSFRAAQLFALSLQFGSRSMSPLQAPLWIPQGLWVFGLAFFALTCIVLLLRVVLAVWRGHAEVARSIALESVDAELAEELRDAQRRGPVAG